MIFILKEREVLTGQRLNELEINGIRLTKFKNGEIGIEFIWIRKSTKRYHRLGSKEIESSLFFCLVFYSFFLTSLSFLWYSFTQQVLRNKCCAKGVLCHQRLNLVKRLSLGKLYNW